MKTENKKGTSMLLRLLRVLLSPIWILMFFAMASMHLFSEVDQYPMKGEVKDLLFELIEWIWTGEIL